MPGPPLRKPLSTRASIVTRGAFLVGALLLAGCPVKRVARPYAPPTATELLASLVKRAGRVRSLRADTKVDYLEGGDRVKVSIAALVEAPDRMRLAAENTFVGAVASLATDGKEFQLLDVRNNRFLAGAASPCNIARLIRVELRPSDVVTVLTGGVPIVGAGDGSDVKAEAGWDDTEGGREVLTLRAPSGAVEVIKLDARDKRWDPVAAELRDPDGKTAWRVKSEDWSDVSGERLPGRIEIEQPSKKADARIRFKDREVNVTPPPAAFHLDPPEGISVERVSCE